jgi:hypothetical protein
MLLAPYSAKWLVTKKSPAIGLISQASTRKVGLFNFNFSASFFQRFFQCFGVVFADAFFQGSRCRFNQVFSFFQTQASCATYCFDNSNFVSASSFQNYVEFSFSSAASTGPAATATAAAAETPNFSSIAEISSTTSITDIADTASMI